MNDDELLTAVQHSLTAARDSVADVRMDRPAGTILRQARLRRLRRGLTAAAATAGAAALALAVLLPGGPLGQQGAPRMAAWNVTTRPGGRVTVTIRQLRDPAGLQRTLRADGVPATVRFGDNNNPPQCLYYPFSPAQGFALGQKAFPPGDNANGGNAFTVDPAVLPAGVGVWITVGPVQDQPGPGDTTVESFSTGWTFVYASGRCPAGQ